MAENEVLARRLARLEQILRKLRKIAGISWEEYARDDSLQDRAERNFQLAAQICIDIGNHVIANNGFRTPESYADIFTVLQEEGILPKDLASTFKKIAGFRNVLVHDYLEIDARTVFNGLQQLADFRLFTEHITAWLSEA